MVYCTSRENNPEKSENGGSLIAVDGSGLKELGSAYLTSPEEAGAFAITHGAGHSAGLNHDGFNSLMSNGFDIMTMIQGSNGHPLYPKNNQCYSCIEDFTNTDNNEKFIEAFLGRFGNNSPNATLIDGNNE